MFRAFAAFVERKVAFRALAAFSRKKTRLLAWDFRIDSGGGFGLDEVRLGFSVLTSVLHGMGSFLFDVSGVDGKPMTACCTRLACPVAMRRL